MVDGQRYIPASEESDRSSRSLRDDRPSKTMTGLVRAIFSIRSQSLRSELAILMMGMPSLQQKLTERSSTVSLRNARYLADASTRWQIVVFAGIDGLLDIANVRTIAKILVDEGLDIAKLQLPLRERC
jgi:hypothetical protein